MIHLTLIQVRDLLLPAFYGLAGKPRPLSERPAGMTREQARNQLHDELVPYIKDDAIVLRDTDTGVEHLVLTADELRAAPTTAEYAKIVNARIAPLRKVNP